MRTAMLRVPTRRGMMGLGDCAWVNGSYVNVLPNGSVVGCGAPPTPAPISGPGASSSVANFYQDVIASDPYYSSPQYLAAEAASGAAPQTPTQAAVSTLNDYCQQNVFNNGIWGTPLDTATCNGITPLSSAMAAAGSVVTPNYYQIAPGGGSGTQGGGPVVTATPAASTPTSKAPSITQPTTSTTTPQTSTVNPGNNASTDLVNGQPAAGSSLNPALASAESWLTASMFGGIPNWMLVAGAVVAVIVIGGKR